MQALVELTRKLAADAGALRFAPPVEHVYNPLEYAWAPHQRYLETYARRGIDAMLVGMNPGPWGMTQTGVPFGEVALVRDWLQLEATVDRPAAEHPARPIEGFACRRSEVSGQRLWGWARDRFQTPAAFFARFFVWNYCPLVFLETSGRNRTPDKLARDERAALYAVCDRALAAATAVLAPQRVIGIGGFALTRATAALGPTELPLGQILHPSPASPLANRGWAAQIEAQLIALGITLDA